MAGKLWARHLRSLKSAAQHQQSRRGWNQQVRQIQAMANSTEDEQKLWVNCKFEVPHVTDLTIPEFIKSQMGPWGDLTAFECIETGKKYTHNQVAQQGRSFGAALIQAGFKPGDIIGVVLNNIPEYCAVLLGIWEAGLVASTVNPGYTAAEIKRQLQSSDSKAVITSSLYLEACRAAKSENAMIQSIIIVGEPHEGCHTFFEMAKADPASVKFPKSVGIDGRNQLALLPYSSGTTGPPKGVMLTHANIATNLIQTATPEYTYFPTYEPGITEQERWFGLLPFFHSYGMCSIMLMGYFKGVNLLTIPRFEPKLFLKSIQHHKPTILHTVTPIISYIVNSADYSAKEFESIRTVFGAAAPIGHSLINQVLDKAGKEMIFKEGYGMTELSPCSHVVPDWFGNSKAGSCGMPVSSTMTKVVDPETGRTLPRGESGEVCVKGPQVMKGYYRNEEATRNTIDADGWLHTGDVAYYDQDDCMYIVDRIKELIKVKGMQVSPSELEDLLRDIPAIEDVAVIGVPDKDTGEAPRAYVVRKKDHKLENDQVHAYLKDQVISYKQLRGGIEYIDAIPKAPSGKILRRELLQAYKEKNGIN